MGTQGWLGVGERAIWAAVLSLRSILSFTNFLSLTSSLSSDLGLDSFETCFFFEKHNRLFISSKYYYSFYFNIDIALFEFFLIIFSAFWHPFEKQTNYFISNVLWLKNSMGHHFLWLKDSMGHCFLWLKKLMGHFF